MQHIEKILQGMYQSIDNKDIYLPLIVSNAIICYKLAHDDEVYWMNFSKKAIAYKAENLKDIYMFFIDFLPQTSQFEKSYHKKIEHLKEFDSFLNEFYYKQKYYFKNPSDFTNHLNRCIEWIPNPKVWEFSLELFKLASEIRFKKDS